MYIPGTIYGNSLESVAILNVFLIYLSKTYFLRHAVGSILNSRANAALNEHNRKYPRHRTIDVKCLFFSDSRPFFLYYFTRYTVFKRKKISMAIIPAGKLSLNDDDYDGISFRVYAVPLR